MCAQLYSTQLRETMGDQLQRFHKRAFEIDDLGEIELVVPPGFGGSALEESAEGETGDWTALARQKVNDILDSIPQNQYHSPSGKGAGAFEGDRRSRNRTKKADRKKKILHITKAHLRA
jgi:hypothetical protein